MPLTSSARSPTAFRLRRWKSCERSGSMRTAWTVHFRYVDCTLGGHFSSTSCLVVMWSTLYSTAASLRGTPRSSRASRNHSSNSSPRMTPFRSSWAALPTWVTAPWLIGSLTCGMQTLWNIVRVGIGPANANPQGLSTAPKSAMKRSSLTNSPLARTSDHAPSRTCPSTCLSYHGSLLALVVCNYRNLHMNTCLSQPTGPDQRPP